MSGVTLKRGKAGAFALFHAHLGPLQVTIWLVFTASGSWIRIVFEFMYPFIVLRMVANIIAK